ncbi:efflux RND transporter permease subunit [Candidatus Uhrbacteria bacterium]|nr:efflux RND transporter permease subunit [Candidatus Uhrbacteria bacterium]
MSAFFNTVIHWSIKHKMTTLIIGGIITVAGVAALLTMKVDILPDVNKPTLAIFTEADGLAAEDVERLIVNPIEWSVSGAPGIEKVRSTSTFGLGIVNIEFQWGTDVYRNRQIIQERLAQANLPKDVRPVIGPISSVMGEIMWVGLTTTDKATVTPMKLRTIADWTLRPALLRIPGISNILIMGGDVKEWQINLNAERLRRYGLHIEDISMEISGSLKNRGGGVLLQNDKEYPIRILTVPSHAEDLEVIAIGMFEGKVIRLGDVADVRELPSVVRGTAAIDGKPGVLLRLVRQPDAETIKVTDAIDETLAQIQKTLPKGVEIKNDLLRQEWFIRAGLKNVIEALRDGTLLLVVILFLFLMNVRITFITLTAIPLSIFVTAIVFWLFGLSVNVMTLGGLAVAIGELVDDAIVGIENVYRRLRTSTHTSPQEADTVVQTASSEVRNSIIYATILVAIAFTPLFFIPGMEGRLLAPLGTAYIVSLIASMIISLTITPVLCSYLLGRGQQLKKHGDTRFVTYIKQKLTPLISWSIDHPTLLIAGVLLSLVISVGLYMGAGKEGIPPFNEGSATIMTILPVSTNLDTTNAFVTSIEQDLMKIPGVLRVSHSAGRSTTDAHGGGSNSSEMQVVFKPGLEEKKKELFVQIQEILDKHPGADYSLGQPITHRLEQLISGVRSPIVIKIFGDDLGDLKETAELIRAELADQSGIKNPRIEKDVTIPELHITPLTNRLAEYGMSPGGVAEELEMGLMGEQLGQVPLGNQRIPVLLRYNLASRGNAQAIADLPLPSSESESLAGSAADVRIEGGRNRYTHEGSRRVLVVSANYQGSNIVGAIDAVKKRMDEKKLPTGTLISYEGTYKSQKENSVRLGIFFIVGLILIFGVLYQAFRSLPIVAQIMLNIPTVFIGSLVGIWLTGHTISLAHLIGFISLTGIVSRNGIMLISRALSLIREGHPFNKGTVITATLERVTPVLMTSAVTALALVPLLIAQDKPGKEMLNPLAVVIFGGLVSSTAISLLLTPAIFHKFGKKSALEAKEEVTGF